jgi:hypothetical protein
LLEALLVLSALILVLFLQVFDLLLVLELSLQKFVLVSAFDLFYPLLCGVFFRR